MSTPRVRNNAAIMLRASITADEWMTLRTIALQTNTPTQTLVAAALRAAYQLTPKETNEHGS
jgi:uncharacterized alpha-E superfamily protein